MSSIGTEDCGRRDLANVAGQVLAHTVFGLDAAISLAESNAETQTAAFSFGVNAVFDLVPGAEGAEEIRNGIGGGASTSVDPGLADIRDAFEGGFTGVRPVD